tara:strand:+ start:816 stop:1856 length:1041 start_codon:yes stop_codon:yes gene_type:complete
MAYSLITKPGLHFNTVLYTGTGSSNSVTGVGFQPDWVWLKKRNSTGNNFLTDVVRGVTKTIYSDANSAEATQSQGLTAFGTDGFTVGTNSNINGSSNTNVAWNWKAGGTGSSNSDGSITSTVSVNTTAGFSIVSYTGTGSNATFGHGLGVAPKMVIIKDRSASKDWAVYHESLGNTKYLELNTTDGQGTASNAWNNTSPTSSVVSIGSRDTLNTSSNNYIAYCFAEKKGYSKFDSYRGNQNTNGSFIYTGFKPAWVMIKKQSSGTGRGWFIFDSKRDGYNVDNNALEADTNVAEATNDRIDLLSNGFKLRTTELILNESGVDYIYMAFAENPLVANVGQGVPATAR